ncbi:DnaB-like helicase C-terminal domain-containing protein [Bacillus velezensis]|uniref:DnaB-like helicase C-terminal domain-containing protein n=1 Tax=Lysinibacillus sp. CD3-6 TaxID=2892541 RepID=UPI00116DAF65
MSKKTAKQGCLQVYSIWNKLLNGFQDAELTIIAARPSIGKTEAIYQSSSHWK